MTSRLPQDAGLPGLTSLFDEAAAIEMVASSLPAQDEVRITGCRPLYVRYKPETTCLVRYDLRYEDPRGAHGTTAQIKAFADDRPRQRAARIIARFAPWTTRLRAAAPFPCAAYLPAVNGLLQIYPVDRNLRFLARAADAGLMTAWLQHGAPGFAGAAVVRDPELVRYKPERKALLRYDLRGPGGTEWGMYGKIHGDDRVGRLALQAEELIAAGVKTPDVLVASPERRFLAHAQVPGAPLAALRGSPAYGDGMEPLARALRDLQAVTVPEAPRRSLADIVADVGHGARFVGRVAPHLAPRVRRLEERIGGRLTSVRERLATCHGDFYDDQALVSDAGVTILDLDELCVGHPLLDVGTMLAHMGVAEDRGMAMGAARAAFLAAYSLEERDGHADLAVFEAVGLLALAPGPFRRLEPAWAEGIERIVALAERCLESERSLPAKPAVHSRAPEDGLHDAGNGFSAIDPALPQLDVLRDRGAMSSRLAAALGEPSVRVTDVALVRHKPGRRAILRYEVSRGRGRRERFYGKTFASARGPRVSAIAGQICAAQAFGPGTALPNPVAYLPEVKLLVQEAVAGTAIEAALLAGETALAREIAAVLHRFHTSGLELGRDHDLARELNPLPDRVAEIGRRYPALRALGAASLDQIAVIPWEASTWRRRPVHRDFYHAQVLRDADRLAVLDLDDAAMSEPAVDVANFAAHLILLGNQQPAHRPAIARMEQAFLEEYARLDAALDRGLTGFLTGTTLVRLAGIHVSRADGGRVAAMLLERAGGLLSGDRSARVVA